MEHTGYWGQYLSEEKDPHVFFSTMGDILFQERYYKDEEGRAFFVTIRPMGGVANSIIGENRIFFNGRWIVDTMEYKATTYELEDMQSYPFAEAFLKVDMEDVEGSIRQCYSEYIEKVKELEN